MMLNKKPENVTRFIGSKYLFKNGKLQTNVFDTEKNRLTGEISVFNVDKELSQKDEEGIFQLGDKTYCKKPPNTLARADLKTYKIEQIQNESTNESLKVFPNIFNKHCNIKPFPNDALAVNIAQKLVRISALKIRNK